MTNLEHIKRGINADNICESIDCSICPLRIYSRDSRNPCTKRVKQWCKEEYRKEKK